MTRNAQVQKPRSDDAIFFPEARAASEARSTEPLGCQRYRHDTHRCGEVKYGTRPPIPPEDEPALSRGLVRSCRAPFPPLRWDRALDSYRSFAVSWLFCRGT